MQHNDGACYSYLFCCHASVLLMPCVDSLTPISTGKPVLYFLQLISSVSRWTHPSAFIYRWDNAAQSFRIPDELARLLDCFLKRGHPIISRDCPYVFSNKYGNGFTDAASLTYYWGKVSKRIGLPASIPPTRSVLFPKLKDSRSSLLLPDLSDLRQ